MLRIAGSDTAERVAREPVVRKEAEIARPLSAAIAPEGGFWNCADMFGKRLLFLEGV